jgi:PadR family transcriptional regulator PadR
MPYSIVSHRLREKNANTKERDTAMVFNTGAALLDAIVLAVVTREPEGTYGYKITQEVRTAIELSESTLYPVLRRLQKDECLDVYDREYAGRNRRYYQVTEKGRRQLNLYEGEWRDYAAKITTIFEGGSKI